MTKGHPPTPHLMILTQITGITLGSWQLRHLLSAKLWTPLHTRSGYFYMVMWSVGR